MNFNEHLAYKGLHAFLGASKYHWLNYDDIRLVESYSKFLAAQRGTRFHEFAAEAIRLGVKLQTSERSLNKYVNDAIGFKMTPEQILYYSDNCFGTADAICFRKGMLRIHDLKTGQTPVKMEQLMIYAALFCLEYKHKPNDIKIELRIYQSDIILHHEPKPEEVLFVMEKIIAFDRIIEQLKLEEE